jgi:hypothetical protein
MSLRQPNHRKLEAASTDQAPSQVEMDLARFNRIFLGEARPSGLWAAVAQPKDCFRVLRAENPKPKSPRTEVCRKASMAEAKRAGWDEISAHGGVAVIELASQVRAETGELMDHFEPMATLIPRVKRPVQATPITIPA